MRPSKRKTLSATLVAQRYRLERELARGGMGTVWIAIDQKLGRQVAVKVMAQELAQMSEALQRFEREALAVAQLRSRHVIEVYDYGVQEGLPYMVMELLEGESLGQRLKREGRIGLGDSLHILRQMVKGLKAAHGAGLVHRDLKPSNIFIAVRDDEQVVKLLDFGVVKAVDTLGSSEATASGMLLGTPQYMSPEQARATRTIDHRSDLWSVAVILFRMLAGVNPFQGESVGDVVLKICSDELPRIGSHAPDLPPELDGFFARAFGRRPADRFQSAEELCAAFQQVLVGQRPELCAPATLDGDASGEFGGRLSQPHASGPYAAQFAAPPAAAPLAAAPLTAAPLAAAPLAVAPPLSPPTPVSGSTPYAYPGEPTPVSTTVGGTQLSSMMPPRFRSAWRSPLAVAVAAGATLVAGGLAAALWFDGSDPSPAAPVAKPPAAHSIAPGATSAPAPADSGSDGVDGVDGGAQALNLDEDLEPAASASGKPATKPSKGGSPPAPGSTTPPPKPKPKPKWF